MVGFICAVNEAVKNKKLTEPCHMTQVSWPFGFYWLLLYALYVFIARCCGWLISAVLL